MSVKAYKLNSTGDSMAEKLNIIKAVSRILLPVQYKLSVVTFLVIAAMVYTY